MKYNVYKKKIYSDQSKECEGDMTAFAKRGQMDNSAILGIETSADLRRDYFSVAEVALIAFLSQC